MRNLIGQCFISFAVLLFSGCEKGNDNAKVFTLETGVESEVGMCAEEQSSLVSIVESGRSQIVNLVWEFPCGAEVDKPYLTVTRNHGATLVFNSDYGKGFCSCARKIDVEIKDRLKGGDTLYIVVNREVVGHKFLIASEDK